MIAIAQYRDCSTAGLRDLDLQLIQQINRLVPGLLVNFSYLPISVGSGVHPYLQAPAVRALERAIADRPGVSFHCNSAYRSLAAQMVLYAHCRARRCGISAAAAPGMSNHNGALALDVRDPRGWRPHLERHGWDWLGSWDEWHFDFVGPGTQDLRWLSIKAFQCLWNFNCPSDKIAEDGRWGSATEQALLKTPIQGFIRVPGGKEIKEPSPSLREGASGSEVLRLQKALNRHNLNLTLTEDGVFGAATKTAVRSYQRRLGLVDDGVVGSMTKAALGLT